MASRDLTGTAALAATTLPLNRALLPDSAALQRGAEKMVSFGPRFTGSDGHNHFLEWMVDEFQQAGLRILPFDEYGFERWLATDWSLDIIEGQGAGPVRLSGYYPYGGETPPGGAVGKLVTPAQIAAGTATAAGNIILVDLGQPLLFTVGQFEARENVKYVEWPDDSWKERNFQRIWTAVAAGGHLEGAAGAVYILNASYAAAVGHYLPFDAPYENLPALYVDRDTGAGLMKLAAANPAVRMVMDARKDRVNTPSIVAVLDGAPDTDEIMLATSHSDGPSIAQENGPIALVELARYFSGLPSQQKLRRSLVFSVVTGHFVAGLPNVKGFLDDHPDLVARAAAAITIEHLGCPEWIDDADGYHATGLPEASIVYAADNDAITSAAITAVRSHGLLGAVVQGPGPFYQGIGGPIEDARIPQTAIISGSIYLNSTNMATPTSPYDGHLDKFDAALAATQVAWSADMITRIDQFSREELAAPPSGG